MNNKTDTQTILIVDDVPENIDVLKAILGPHYKIKAALRGRDALELAARQSRLDLVLLDVMMPEMDGYEVCRQLKSNPATAKIPVIFVTANEETEDEEKGFKAGAVDYITKPISPPVVLARVKTHLALYDQNCELESKVQERTTQLNETRLRVIQILGRAAEYKDNETGFHVIRMSHYSRLLAMALTNNESWAELIYNAAPMHDVGKIGIPDHILRKPGKLDDDEWEIMKKHSEYGANIIGDDPSPILQMAKEMALTHHEKWDGSGYPYGLKGEEIPISGRITAITDVFDALTFDRPYKKAWHVDDAIKLINDEAGKHFDPQLVPLFMEILPDVLVIKERYAEN